MSNESQLLQLTKEDIVLKCKLLERIQRSDDEFKDSLTRINNVMWSIVNGIQQNLEILA